MDLHAGTRPVGKGLGRRSFVGLYEGKEKPMSTTIDRCGQNERSLRDGRSEDSWEGSNAGESARVGCRLRQRHHERQVQRKRPAG
jgi:hypothetical protein